MSRAFTKEQDDVPVDLGERSVSPFRNLVTVAGLQAIDANITRLQGELAEANINADKIAIAHVSRDLRYWLTRRETAEVSVPDPASDVVRFGMSVEIEDENGKSRIWTIVGEDEADPSKGTISHVSPVAMLLFGKPAGDVVMINGHPWEIVSFSVAG